MWIFIISAVLLLLLVAKKLFDNKKYADFYSIKGPKTIPLLGNVLIFGIQPNPLDVFQIQLRLAEKYGGFFRLVMGKEKILLTSRPEHVEAILGSSKHLKKSKAYNMFVNWLGHGLINSSGSHWRKHRNIIEPTFHIKCLQDYSTFMSKNLRILIDILHTKKSEMVKIDHLIKLYALDTICDSAMRYNIHMQVGGEHPYVQALEGYLQIHMTRFFSVLLRPALVFNNSALGRQQAAHVDRMKSFTNEVINSRKAKRAKTNNSHTNFKIGTESDTRGTTKSAKFDECPRRSFLDLLLDKRDEEGVLTDAEIRDEVSTFLFGGHDTVTSSISFCLYELARHPDVQDKLVNESYTVMPPGREIQVDCTNISALTYLDSVMKECMRIYTPVPFIEREIDEDVVLDGKLIPAGTTIQIMIHMMHNNPTYYPQPEKFDPERFNIKNSVNRHPYAYIPFSAGSRKCIGYKYAQIMIKATIINILRNFTLSQSEDGNYKPLLYNSGILKSANGLNIILVERHKF